MILPLAEATPGVAPTLLFEPSAPLPVPREGHPMLRLPLALLVTHTDILLIQFNTMIRNATIVKFKTLLSHTNPQSAQGLYCRGKVFREEITGEQFNLPCKNEATENRTRYI
jgi:hypothetical protein